MVDFDLVVIGAGSAGLTAVDFAVEFGEKVALVEKYRVGGDCTWTGCVPSKALLQVARVVKMANTAVSFGLTHSPTKVDMKQVHTQIQKVIADIYQHETIDVLRDKGIDVFTGAAQFVDSHTIQVDGKRITSRKFIVATGAKPFVPPISGLETIPTYFCSRGLYRGLSIGMGIQRLAAKQATDSFLQSSVGKFLRRFV